MFSECGPQRYYPALKVRDEDILGCVSSVNSVIELENLWMYTPKSKSWLPEKRIIYIRLA
jgi:hypothetical protein